MGFFSLHLMRISKSEITRQFNRAKLHGWLPFFEEAAETITKGFFDASDLVAIASRETNLDPIWLTMPGDGGNGFGLMQADRRSFPAFTKSNQWKDARTGILFGAKVLMQKWLNTQNCVGARVSVISSKGGTFSFTGKTLNLAECQRVTIAAYNCGRWAHYAISTGEPIDAYSTGHDYSSDVIARAAEFRKLINPFQAAENEAAAKELTPENISNHIDSISTEQAGLANPTIPLVVIPTQSVEGSDAPEPTQNGGGAEDLPAKNTQIADAIVNNSQDADKSKVDAAQTQLPTNYEKPPPTGLGAKLTAFFSLILTGQYVVPQFVSDGASTNSGMILQFVGDIFRALYENRYLVFGGIVVWIVVKKVNNYLVMRHVTNVNTDLTRGNIVLTDAPKVETDGYFTRWIRKII